MGIVVLTSYYFCKDLWSFWWRFLGIC